MMLTSASYSSLIQSWVKLQRQWSNDEPPRWSIDSSTTPPTLRLNHHARLFSTDNDDDDDDNDDIFGANDSVEERGDRRTSTSSHMDEDLTSSFETEIESDQLAATTTTTTATTTTTTTTTTEPQERPSLSLTIQICYDQGELIFFFLNLLSFFLSLYYFHLVFTQSYTRVILFTINFVSPQSIKFQSYCSRHMIMQRVLR